MNAAIGSTPYTDQTEALKALKALPDSQKFTLKQADGGTATWTIVARDQNQVSNYATDKHADKQIDISMDRLASRSSQRREAEALATRNAVPLPAPANDAEARLQAVFRSGTMVGGGSCTTGAGYSVNIGPQQGGETVYRITTQQGGWAPTQTFVDVSHADIAAGKLSPDVQALLAEILKTSPPATPQPPAAAETEAPLPYEGALPPPASDNERVLQQGLGLQSFVKGRHEVRGEMDSYKITYDPANGGTYTISDPPGTMSWNPLNVTITRDQLAKGGLDERAAAALADLSKAVPQEWSMYFPE